MWNTFVQPTSNEETLTFLNKYNSKARIINGGMDLLFEFENNIETFGKKMFKNKKVSKISGKNDEVLASLKLNNGSGWSGVNRACIELEGKERLN